MWRRVLRKPLTWVFVAVFGLLAGVGLWWFQPWKLVTDRVVEEALPAGIQVLAAGEFISHEHETSGTAQIVRLADGRRQLVLRDLDTSNGPDLRVWLTDQPVIEGVAGWRVFDDGTWVELARLKGNRGDQVYEVAPSTDLSEVRSVAIWCKRFAVSFGAAELTTR